MRTVYVNVRCRLQDLYSLQTRARVLSRKVWDLLMVLPTNPRILKTFQNLPESPDVS